ncbi:MAG TPA: hypothetical protein VFB79_04880 [Candidatus Angelobacter sp.]|nr:hypothetical protein [Candidatus Angelobacter sp.]
MAKVMVKTKQNERGMALLLALFALLLLSAIGLFMVISSTTETRIDANYGSNLKAYYAARSGLEEIRDRITYPSSSGGLSDKLPQDIAGNPGGVLYILNPSNGETVDPTDVTSPYFDDQLCHDYNSGAFPGIKCTSTPTVPNWQLRQQSSMVPASGPLGYKWIRLNIKTNRIAAPYYVDQTGTSAPLDTWVCWDGAAEQLSSGSANPSCDANGMQTVYMITALAATPQPNGPSSARKLLRFEVAAPSIRPAGMLTMGASGTMPVLASSTGLPTISVDGRVHQLDRSLSTSSSCSAIAPLAADATAGSAQLEQALNQARLNIVQAANASCNLDGSSANNAVCTPGMWWVRGTDIAPRFVTSDGTTGSGSTGTGTLTGSPGGSSGGSSGGRGRSEDDLNGGHHHQDPTGVGSTGCDPTNPACYSNLDLSAPELMAVSASMAAHIPLVTLQPNASALFQGNHGNQADTTIFQPSGAQTVQNEIAAVNNLVYASMSQTNYFAVSSTMLASSYGTQTTPAIVVVSDPVLSLSNGASLSGYGVLVVTNGLEINNARLQWNGIVLVQSSTGHLTIGQGATGYINGVLLMQPGANVSLQNSSTASSPFQLTYSCDAVDLPFNNQPFRIISTSEASPN